MNAAAAPVKLGLLGGTFDPVHYGHLLLAEQCREQCGLDELWFVPAHIPPHKSGCNLTPGAVRAEMLERALADHPRMSVSRIELERPGQSYTVQTLEHLHAQDPRRELYFLIGADSLRDLPGWREPERIAALATIVAVNRGDRPLPDLDDLAGRLGRSTVERLRLVQMPGVDFSGTDLRERVSSGRSIRYMTPPAVAAYIEEHGLYRSPAREST